jgi:hypothetical protein
MHMRKLTLVLLTCAIGAFACCLGACNRSPPDDQGVASRPSTANAGLAWAQDVLAKMDGWDYRTGVKIEDVRATLGQPLSSRKSDGGAEFTQDIYYEPQKRSSPQATDDPAQSRPGPSAWYLVVKHDGKLVTECHLSNVHVR